MKEAGRRAEAILLANRKSLDKLAQLLVEKETIDETDVTEILKDAKLPKEAALY